MLNHLKLIRISGLVWLLVGAFLFQFGVTLLNQALPPPIPFKMWTHPLLELFSPWLGNRENAALLVIVGCLATGLIKGRFVLSRSAQRGINRILSLPNPSPVWKIYSLSYYLLIGAMIGLGSLLRHSSLPVDLRAACYLSIGFALMTSSKIYLTYGKALPQES